MIKKAAHPHDGKSIKTFFIYAAIVLVLILVSLTLKTFFLLQQSKYNDQHFSVAVAQNGIVKEVVVVNPAESTLSILKLTDTNLKLQELARSAGIATDGHINIQNNSSDLIQSDASETLLGLTVRYHMLDTNLTIIDIGRLGFYTKQIPPNKKTLREISSAELIDTSGRDRSLVVFFSDEVIATENVSIQIVNATGIVGIAQRLERVLLQKGANVVSVTTSQKKESRSSITYFGEGTYTLEKIKTLLGLPATKRENKTIADIIITIGEDRKNTTNF